MSSYEFIGMVVLVAIPSVTSIFKLTSSITKFTIAVENLLEWQKVKDNKDLEQDKRLDNHELRIEIIENRKFVKDRVQN